jgi:hypothetical protein
MPLLRESKQLQAALAAVKLSKTSLRLLPDRSDGWEGDGKDDAHLISQLRFLNPMPGTRPTEQCRMCAQLFALLTPRRQAEHTNITN